MAQPAYLWIKSERSPDTKWGRYLVEPGPGTLVPLVGPDSFELVTEDRDGVEWRDPEAVPIRELLRTKKLTELVLGGKLVYETKLIVEWNPWTGRWEERTQQVAKRIAVVYTLKFSDGTTQEKDAPATGRRPAPAPELRPQIFHCPPPMFFNGPSCSSWGW